MVVLQLGRGTGAQLGAVMNTTSFAASQAPVDFETVLFFLSQKLLEMSQKFSPKSLEKLILEISPFLLILSCWFYEMNPYCLAWRQMAKKTETRNCVPQNGQVGSYLLLAILVSIFSNQLKQHAKAM